MTRPQPVAIPEYWFGGSEFKSLFFDAGSIAIPPAEGFVRDTMAVARPHIHDTTLKTALDELSEDERIHSLVHGHYNALLTTRGLRFHTLVTIDIAIGNAFRLLDLKSRLAVCAAIEHLTAMMSFHLLERVTLRHEEVAEPVRRLWIWHSIEELEHRSVALLIYRALGGGYMRRVLYMLLVSFLYALTTSSFLISFLSQQKLLASWRVWKDGISFLFGAEGLYLTLLQGIGMYMRPGFDPEKDISLSRALDSEEQHYEAYVRRTFIPS